MTKLTTNEIKLIKSYGKDIENATINIFELAEIEDRYTEKEIICDACAVIKILLNEIIIRS